MRDYTREELERAVIEWSLLGLYPPKPEDGFVTYTIRGVPVSYEVIMQSIEEKLERMYGEGPK